MSVDSRGGIALQRGGRDRGEDAAVEKGRQGIGYRKRCSSSPPEPMPAASESKPAVPDVGCFSSSRAPMGRAGSRLVDGEETQLARIGRRHRVA
jgi:hypothetical protein